MNVPHMLRSTLRCSIHILEAVLSALMQRHLVDITDIPISLWMILRNMMGYISNVSTQA